MAARSGISAQWGMAAEVTVGSRVTVTNFVPLVSESVKREETFTESEGIRAGRLVRTSDQWNSGLVTISGDVGLELNTKNLAPLLRQMFGQQDGTSGTFTFYPGDLHGDSFTMQFGKPDVGGTVRPFTYGGTKVLSWEIACAPGEIATLGLTVQTCLVDETTGVALATASYTTGQKAFKFSGATVTVAGSTMDVKQMTISGDNALSVERNFLGSQYIKEPIQTGLRVYGGALQPEFESLTAYQRFIDHTEAAIVASFVNGTDTLTITMNARFDGETPSIGGRDVLEQPLPFTCVATAAGADSTAIQAVYVTS